MTEEQLRQIEEEEARKAELEKLAPISFAEYEKVIHKWMLVADTGIVKLLPALYVANMLKDRDPVWMMVIGPSGGGKTELLGAMLDMPAIYSVSLLTPNTFLSGFPGKNDSSLLPKVNGKIMQFKDWTSVLSMNKDARSEIMGQLREIFDGHMKKPFGNGRVAEWKGKVGILAGCTPAVDIASQMHASLGERFVQYRLAMPDRLEVARRCMDNTKDVKQMRTEMRDAFYAFMKSVQTGVLTGDLPEEAKGKLIQVANVATLARSGIIRDLGFKKEVVYVPSPEMPTRIVQQLSTIATSLMIVNGGAYDPKDMDILMKIAMDSIPQTNRMVMEQVAIRTWQTTSDIAIAVGYPTAPIHMYLENLAMLGVVKRIRAKDAGEGAGTGDRWEMAANFVVVINESKGYGSYQPPAIEEEKDEEVPVEQIFQGSATPVVGE
jgi:hypothetical protein